MVEVTPIMQKKIKNATQIVQNYNGNNKYLLHLKERIKDQYFKIDSEIQKYVHKYYKVKAKDVGKYIDMHPFFKIYYGEKLGIKGLDNKIYVDQLLSTNGEELHIWCEVKPNDGFFKLRINKNFFLTDEEVDLNAIDYNISDVIELKEHQKIAVRKLISNPRYILGDIMGLGKTISAISSAVIGDFEKILIICPASLKYNWKREIQFFDSEENISVINGSSWKENKWNIINPDILKNFHRLPVNEKGRKIDRSEFSPTPFELAEFDLIIVDEAHYFKNEKAKRSKLFYDFAQFTKYVWLLTGTPIPNKIEDIYNLLRIIDSPLGNNWDDFIKRYCKGRYFPRKGGGKFLKSTGVSNKEELNELLKNHILRRTTKTSGVELPNKFVRPIYLEMNKQYKYQEYLDEYNEWYEEQLSEGKKPSLNQHLDQLVKLRKFLAESKIGATIEMIENFIEQEKKVVVFSCFTDSLNKIHNHFNKKSVLVDGSVKSEMRQVAVDQFQKDDSIKVFCGNIIAAGVGLTLTEGTVVLFNDLDWVPANHAQAEKRAHRIGQTEDVNIFYMLLSDSIDENIFASLKRKTKNIEDVIGDESDSLQMSEEVLKEVLNVGFV